MANTCENAQAHRLIGLLKRIDRGDNLKSLYKDAGQLADGLAPSDIATAERRLLDSGYTPQVVQQLSATFVLMGLYNRHEDTSSGGLPDNHLLRKVTVEHDLFRCFVGDLQKVSDDISGLESLSNVSAEFRRLVHVVGHLSALKEHLQREEDVIFPYLNRRGCVGVCRAAEKDHARIRTDIDNLATLIASRDRIRSEDFKAALAAIAGRLGANLLEHFAFEDRILCPVALVVIDDPTTWEALAALCDEIGYCGIHGRQIGLPQRTA